MSRDNHFNHRRIPQHDRNLNSSSNLPNLPPLGSNFEPELARNYSHSHSSANPPSSQPYSHLPSTPSTTATTATNMIGASTAFYDDAIHGPGVILGSDGEPDHEIYSTYLASFQQQQQQQIGGYNYSSNFPADSHTQAHPQSYSQSQNHPQYLPTPSVSPTSTSSVMSPTARQTRQGPSQQSQYSTLTDAVPMGAVYCNSSNPSTSNNNNTTPNNAGSGTTASERRAQAQKKSKSGAASSTTAIAGSAKPSPNSSRKRARKSFDRPASPLNQSQSQTLHPQNQLIMQDDSDDEDQEDRNQPTQRLPGACRYCKKLKMKCDFATPDALICKRCKAGGHQCVVEGRKPRTGPNKREFLLSQLRQKESIIESLLRQINNPVHQTPLTLLVPNMSSVTSNTSNNGTTLPDTNLQSIPNTSVKNAGGRGGLAAFSLDKRAEGIDLLEDEDADDPGIRRHIEDDVDADGGDDDDDADDAGDASVSLGGSGKKAKLHYLPEEAAPLGLIADLSLENHTPKKKEKEKEGSVGAGAKDDAGSQYESRGQSAIPANANAEGAHESSDPNDPSPAQGPNADTNQQPPAEEENENNVGVANKSYFHPGPATDLSLRRVIAERTMPPDILVHGLVTPEDVEELFKIFYERINVFLSILDPAIHTPARTFGRCPFLFTVVCAISSRYYPPKASIYKYAMHFAKSAAASSLIDGWKSIELCQAYLLMSVYAVPARRWEEDRSWLYLGLAIRIATDLNLHQPSSTAISAVANANTNSGNSIENGAGDAHVNGSGSGGKLARLQNQNRYPSHPLSSIPSSVSSNPSQNAISPSTPTATTSSPLNTSVTATSLSSFKANEKAEKSEREFLNRTRTWLICFNLDRSISTQLGKPSTIKEDFIIRNASEWYKRSPYNMSFDIQLCAYTELLRIVTRFHDEVWSGSRGVGSGVGVKGADVDFYTITMRYDNQLRAFQEQAAARFERDSKKDDPGSVYRTGLLPFMVNYSRLVMFSFGFQQAVEKGLQRDDIFFQRCFDAACGVITTVVERLAPTGYLRFAPDGHFIFVSFAAAFLLKLLRPDFSRIVNRSHKDHVLTLVRKLIRTLGSSDVAVDDKHTPKLYSRFLAGLVSRHSTRKKVDPVLKVQQNIGNENGQMRILQGPSGQGHIHAPPSAQGAVDYGSPNSHYDYDLSSPPQMIPSDTLPAGHGYIPSNSQGYVQNVQYPSAHYAGEPQQAPGHSTLEYYESSPSPGLVQRQHFLSDMNMESVQQQTRGIAHAQSPGSEAFDDTTGTALPDHEYLASMQAINNAGWWGHVMMPGFTYPGGNNYTGNQQPQQQVQFGQMDFDSDTVVPHSQYSAPQSQNTLLAYSETEEYPYRFEG